MADLPTLEAAFRAKLNDLDNEFDRVGGLPAKTELARMVGELTALLAQVPDELGALADKVKAAAGRPLDQAAAAVHDEFHAAVSRAAADLPISAIGRLMGELRQLVQRKAQAIASDTQPPGQRPANQGSA
jgi:hypothetical protein